MNRASARLVAGLVIALALVTGAIAGIAIDRRFLMDWRRGGPGRPGFAREGPQKPVARLRDELGLSPGQTTVVDSVIKHRMAQRDSVLSHVRPQLRATLDSTRIDIELVLTPEQKVKFQQMRDRERARHHFPPEIESGGPPPPPGADTTHR